MTAKTNPNPMTKRLRTDIWENNLINPISTTSLFTALRQRRTFFNPDHMRDLAHKIESLPVSIRTPLRLPHSLFSDPLGTTIDDFLTGSVAKPSQFNKNR
ncbi:hypothetical protein [Saccharospirillum alexandrii]|uniref:hypothetical protein n=1 Tax=Saccharospirillum alexandrii TaxID=2448477 RepID=UPI0013E08D88|nr:hypothetical protein [Saccharospirillum alexandrii]